MPFVLEMTGNYEHFLSFKMMRLRTFPLLFVLILSAFMADAQIQSTDSLDDFTIDKIYIIGNRKTHKSIILRELGFEEGGTYLKTDVPQMIEDANMRVYNTNLFNKVDVQFLNKSDSTSDVMVSLDERWYFYPAPIFRIEDRNFMDWLVNRSGGTSRLNVGGKLDQFNFRGRNEQLRFLSELGFDKGQVIRQRHILNYVIPYIEKTQRNGLIFDFAYTEQEDIAYQTTDHIPTLLKDREINRIAFNSQVTHSFRPNYYSTHYTSIGFKTTSITDTVAILNPNYLGDSRKHQKAFRLKYQFINDRRNNRNFPTQGYYFNAYAKQNGLGIFDDLSIFSMQAIYSRYRELGKGWYLANGLIGFASFPQNQPYFNYSGIGYDDIFMRGFELVVVEGPNFILSKNSLRKLLFKTKGDISNIIPIDQFDDAKLELYAKFFVDGGFVENYPRYEISNRLSDTYLYSVGLGIDMVTMYDLVIRFEYSYNSAEELNFALNIKADIQ